MTGGGGKGVHPLVHLLFFFYVCNCAVSSVLQPRRLPFATSILRRAGLVRRAGVPQGKSALRSAKARRTSTAVVSAHDVCGCSYGCVTPGPGACGLASWLPLSRLPLGLGEHRDRLPRLAFLSVFAIVGVQEIVGTNVNNKEVVD